jgi:hypothetical protein
MVYFTKRAKNWRSIVYKYNARRLHANRLKPRVFILSKKAYNVNKHVSLNPGKVLASRQRWNLIGSGAEPTHIYSIREY